MTLHYINMYKYQNKTLLKTNKKNNVILFEVFHIFYIHGDIRNVFKARV
jgi:hypothetical protein